MKVVKLHTDDNDMLTPEQAEYLAREVGPDDIVFTDSGTVICTPEHECAVVTV